MQYVSMNPINAPRTQSNDHKPKNGYVWSESRIDGGAKKPLNRILKDTEERT